ncbi:MAG: helix-turn-helix domain-containing protein, partial [Pseudomonadota bacterium]|nr:helix-turn-helix domain-containing protein [Pseudomonadota bacterium]
MTADNSSANNNSSADSNNEELMSSQEQSRRPIAGPGHILKEAREAKSMTPREAADRLRLRLQVIELIEADDY